MSQIQQALFQLTKSPNGGMWCLSVKDPEPKVRWYLRRAIMANHRDDKFYQRKHDVNPFLQCDGDNYMLIEFWCGDKKKVTKYVDFLNKSFETTKRQEQLFLGTMNPWC